MNARYTSSRKDWSKMRIILLLGALILVWAGLWVRTYFIQVVHGLELSGNSRGQYWTEELVRGHRGDIYLAIICLLSTA